MRFLVLTLNEQFFSPSFIFKGTLHFNIDLGSKVRLGPPDTVFV